MLAFDPLEPFNSLPAPPPVGELESKAVLKACITARTTLAELRGACRYIPNPAVLINTIPLLEAQASSEIENIVTTADALFRSAQLGDDTADAATKEALRYRQALVQGHRSLAERPLCTATAALVCSVIKDVDMQVRRVPGTALKRSSTGEVVYTPPVGEALIRDKLGEWERFVHGVEDLDPLVRMAVAHYQFEAIHPFNDGNGRTGRILNLLTLLQYRLLDVPVLYLSRAILHRRADYYRHLLEVTTQGAWEPWILFMLDAVRETARWTTSKIGLISRTIEHTTGLIREKAPQIFSTDLVFVLFSQPYCRIKNLVDAGLGKRETASRYLKVLVDIGVLQEVRVGREKLFLHREFLRALTVDGAEPVA